MPNLRTTSVVTWPALILVLSALLTSPVSAGSGSYATWVRSNGPSNPYGVVFQMADDGGPIGGNQGVFYCFSNQSPGADQAKIALFNSRNGHAPLYFMTGDPGVIALHASDCAFGVTHVYRIDN